MNKLIKAAAQAVNKSESDVKILRKMANDGFNRVFEIPMDDDTAVLARLPFPYPMPRCLAVASEVATTNFVRAHGVPTPRLFGYAISEIPVRSEYTLLERRTRQTLDDCWFDLSEQQRL